MTDSALHTTNDAEQINFFDLLENIPLNENTLSFQLPFNAEARFDPTKVGEFIIFNNTLQMTGTVRYSRTGQTQEIVVERFAGETGSIESTCRQRFFEDAKTIIENHKNHLMIRTH